MRIEIRKHLAYEDHHGDWNEQLWGWLIRAENGAPMAESTFTVTRRNVALRGVLAVTGLSLPERTKGSIAKQVRDLPQQRGGTADVWVAYGAGGQVVMAQWKTSGGEFIELTEVAL
jgi:hypothetical protein